MALIATFSPEDIVFVINDYQITDFASGSFIEVNKNKPFFRPEKGIRGKHTRVRNRDRSGTVVIRLMQTSNQNDILNKIAYEDDLNQTGLLFVTIRDVGGNTGLQLGNAYLEGPPNLSFQGDTTSPREWVIHYEFFARYDVGGSQRAPLDFLSNIIQ